MIILSIASYFFTLFLAYKVGEYNGRSEAWKDAEYFYTGKEK